MLAHNQGGMLNSALLARNLGLDVKTINSYLDLLVDLLLVRRLPPWHANLGKRLVKAPRIFVRDRGLVHALAGVPDRETLLSHLIRAGHPGSLMGRGAPAPPAGPALPPSGPPSRQATRRPCYPQGARR
jgi:hypothetical protein